MAVPLTLKVFKGDQLVAIQGLRPRHHQDRSAVVGAPVPRRREGLPDPLGDRGRAPTAACRSSTWAASRAPSSTASGSTRARSPSATRSRSATPPSRSSKPAGRCGDPGAAADAFGRHRAHVRHRDPCRQPSRGGGDEPSAGAVHSGAQPVCGGSPQGAGAHPRQRRCVLRWSPPPPPVDEQIRRGGARAGPRVARAPARWGSSCASSGATRWWGSTSSTPAPSVASPSARAQGRRLRDGRRAGSAARRSSWSAPARPGCALRFTGR